MKLSSLSFLNFRCFSSRKFEFKDKLNFISAPNGAGKTSLLEGVGYLSTGRILRGKERAELIKIGHEAAYIRVEFGTHVEISCGLSAKERILKINGIVKTSFKEVKQYFQPILFTNQDIEIIAGTPQLRRNFFYEILISLSDEVTSLFYKIKAILEQRKNLLKAESLDLSLLKIWSEKLFANSVKIGESVDELLRNIDQCAKELALKIDIPISFRLQRTSSIPISNFEEFWSYYESKVLPKERALGRTLWGTQADDISINVDLGSSRKFASRGQQKILILFLKTIHGLLIKQKYPTVSRPFFIDDAFSELDLSNKSKLLKMLDLYDEQVILTTPIAN